jgi:hypothetical protein
MGAMLLDVIPLSLATIGITFIRSAVDAFGALGIGQNDRVPLPQTIPHRKPQDGRRMNLGHGAGSESP